MEVCRLIRRDPSCSGIPLAVVKLLSQEAASFLESECVFDASLQLPESGVMFERIKSLLGTKARQESLGGTLIEAGDLIIDPTRYEVTCRGKPAMLTTLEFQLLHYLAARRNRAFTRNQLFTALWGGRSSNPRVVDVYIRRIRLKIEPDPNRPVHLKTLVGRGYQFV
jgi:DNA-binding response OmpR family regulator